jgi:hypothetical protein
MPTRDEYLKLAADCLNFAWITRDREMRVVFVVLAQKWLDLADYNSNSSSQQTRTEERLGDRKYRAGRSSARE